MKKTFTFGKFFNMLRLKVLRGTHIFNASSGEKFGYFSAHPEDDFRQFYEIGKEFRFKETGNPSFKNGITLKTGYTLPIGRNSNLKLTAA